MTNQDFVICANTGTKITREMIIGCISDTHKSAYGFRPRGIYNYDAMSIDELGDLLTELQDIAEREYKRELYWERIERKLNAKRQKETISKIKEMGAITKANALRWLELAKEDDYYLNWQQEAFLESERDKYPMEEIVFAN